MIAFLGAMKIEVEGIQAQMTEIAIQKVGPYEFYCGKLHGKEIVVAQCGIGKVSAAACATALIQTCHPDLLVNTGVAGGLLKAQGMRTGDLVIGTKTIHHDADATAIGYPMGQVPEQPLYFPCDEAAAEKFYKIAQEKSGVHVFRGIIASGDTFVGSEEKSKNIHETFDAAACEMEGAALGQTAHIFDTPFCVIRAISDCADDDAHMDYPTFEKRAAAVSIALVSEFVKEW